MSAEVIPTLTEPEARRLTERIRAALDRVSTAWSDLAERVTEAYERRADLALGYSSWADYAEAELRPPSQLAAEVRRELVGLLSASGMGSRAIAPVVGMTDRGVRKSVAAQVGTEFPPAQDRTGWTPEDHAEQDDLDATDDLIDFATGEVLTDQRGGTEPPSPVTDVEEQETGPQQPPAPRPATIGLDGKTYPRPAASPRRRSIVDAARDAASDLHRAAEKVERIFADDRYPKNREQVAEVTRGYLSRTVELLDRINSL